MRVEKSSVIAWYMQRFADQLLAPAAKMPSQSGTFLAMLSGNNALDPGTFPVIKNGKKLEIGDNGPFCQAKPRDGELPGSSVDSANVKHNRRQAAGI